MLLRFGLVSVVSLLLVACYPVRNPVTRMPFPEAEYAQLPRRTVVGAAEIRGQAFLKTRGGDVKKAAGNEVLLNPVTSYSNQWFDVAVVNEQPLTEPDPRLADYLRAVTADADGRFTFAGVPPGEYYVSTKIVWEVPSAYGGLRETGGFVFKKITIKDGDKLDLILTQ